MIGALEIVGVVDGSGNYKTKNGRGCGGGRSAFPAMQIKYGQRWAASLLGWCNWVSKIKVYIGLIIQLCGSVNAK